ncbi:hypothetical protein, variant 5 [Cryptococcus amylolentus CBS 6039]|uniref:Uncharacterized protein n=1 Tax=Cryptococcus amylolentus CBS 6039 TaxID=1295533 RepID=A0A1E3I450_9TREE|nr:hypothetical protein L202_01484 [Cryptococcus amylolentus CBS 6039]XP_018997319.1 hypothetical protein, variant 1 [Cryptococcus amylolentus CBS 6039]XP_018997320.1 hypothetical protein, variant 2 [Cryptococcus amylolentus CBS 6039]XP_018997321.1 hypothetical protein, variant 3 [Cryptococcus amylolentus CBS 6039]XP_018997322.1 hypothetical protein, variant 4 [Cryptococcus amylolentus CBS 6039]XP_018997323.1 hypothetical protein, variant 5 [Cryptococcus amylolentus CBS 6039]ODN83318.1 hypoth
MAIPRPPNQCKGAYLTPARAGNFTTLFVHNSLGVEKSAFDILPPTLSPSPTWMPTALLVWPTPPLTLMTRISKVSWQNLQGLPFGKSNVHCVGWLLVDARIYEGRPLE